MPRNYRQEKPLIYVFCEGESEQSYTQFLKEEFADAATIKCVSQTGLFEFADDKFKKDAKFRVNKDIIDEIWFFFDVESFDLNKWDKRYCIINRLRKFRKSPRVRVRLLMTTACIEYWFILHYHIISPPIATPADKEHMLHLLPKKVPSYKKGDENSTKEIAKHYSCAVSNGKQVLFNLRNEGLPSLEDNDERNRWLIRSGRTFTTVHEAIVFLEQLKSNKITPES